MEYIKIKVLQRLHMQDCSFYEKVKIWIVQSAAYMMRV